MDTALLERGRHVLPEALGIMVRLLNKLICRKHIISEKKHIDLLGLQPSTSDNE